MTSPHPLAGVPVSPQPELAAYEQAVSNNPPFFDPADCAKAAVQAALQARRNAWARRRLGDEAGFVAGMERVRWYAARARLWAGLIEWVEETALDG